MTKKKRFTLNRLASSVSFLGSVISFLAALVCCAWYVAMYEIRLNDLESQVSKIENKLNDIDKKIGDIYELCMTAKDFRLIEEGNEKNK